MEDNGGIKNNNTRDNKIKKQDNYGFTCSSGIEGIS